MSSAPQIITPTEGGIYLVPMFLHAHGAFLPGFPARFPMFDRAGDRRVTPEVVATSNPNYWHQRN